MQKLWFILLIALSIFSCDKNDSEIENKIITQSWAWQRSNGGLTGNSQSTPASSGENKVMTFYADSVEIAVNGEISTITSYFIQPEESILHNETFDILTINYTYFPGTESEISLPMRYIIRKLSDQLILEEDVFDGYVHYYQLN